MAADAHAIEASYDVIMPDVRGHGGSSRLEGQLGIDVRVADALLLIRTLGLGKLVVIGHSLGADIAGRLTVAQALVLVDPALQNIAAAMHLDLNTPPPWLARSPPPCAHSVHRPMLKHGDRPPPGAAEHGGGA